MGGREGERRWGGGRRLGGGDGGGGGARDTLCLKHAAPDLTDLSLVKVIGGRLCSTVTITLICLLRERGRYSNSLIPKL